MELPSSVDSPSSPTPCPTRLRTLFSHNLSAMHSPFSASCATRGKPMPSSSSPIPVFQFPSIPQPRFRKLTHLSTHSPPTTSAEFPLFLPERRVLLSYFFIPYIDSLYPSHLAPPAQFIPGIQRYTPVFHAHINAKVHTIKNKKRKPFPAATGLLYSVASADSASIRFSSTDAR